MPAEQDVGAVFAALADPTRRQLVMSLAAGSTVTATRLSADLPMTRQAIAKHLAMLDHAGLVARRAARARDALPPDAGAAGRCGRLDGGGGWAVG